MNTKALLWKAANATDDHWNSYKNRKAGYPPIEKLPVDFRELIYRMLDPDPAKRLSLPEILQDPNIKNVEMCTSSHSVIQPNNRHTHRHYGVS